VPVDLSTTVFDEEDLVGLFLLVLVILLFLVVLVLFLPPLSDVAIMQRY